MPIIKNKKVPHLGDLGGFPEDFMFRLTKDEYEFLRFQIGSLEKGKHSKYLPYAFTEQGIAMLSGILKSERAIEVNIQIMRAFIKLKTLIMPYTDMRRRIEEIEKKYESQDEKIKAILKLLCTPQEEDTSWASGFGPAGFLRG
ncbi:MAG: ORF6N domain-containing protein [Candidatus Margulisiibacteriota bacterium]